MVKEEKERASCMLLSYVQLFATPRLLCPWVLSRQEYWSGFPCPPPGIEPKSPELQVDSLLSEPSGKPKNTGVGSLSLLQGTFLTQDLNQGLLHGRQIPELPGITLYKCNTC